MDKRSEQLLDQIQRVGNVYATLERKLVFEHKGTKLHGSEIHFMQAVSGEPELNLTEVAGKLGITKGAASQTLTRLKAKGMIVGESDPYNKNQLQMELTKQGRAALEAFHKRIGQQWQELSSYLGSLSQKDQGTVSKFLVQLESFFIRMG